MAVGSYLDDPAWPTALRYLQQGQWEAGLAELGRIAQRYPRDESLQALGQEMEIRARIDQDEQEDNRRVRRQRYLTLAARLLAVLVFIGLAYWGFAAYSEQFQQQIEIARQKLDLEVQTVTLAGQLRDDQAYLRAGRPEEALAVLAEISARNGDVPELPALLAEAEAAAALEAEYAAAIQLVENQDWPAALAALQEIEAQHPNYRDVALQTAQIERGFLLDDALAQAEAQFQAGRWEAAAAAYEGVRDLDPTYRKTEIEDRLFNSYTRAARATLVGRTDSLEALQIAENYFRKALTIRPQDPEVKTERELARLFLKAQADFIEGQWSDVITGLEFVFAEEPEYANGTARHTLYEAYLGRGDQLMLDGEFGLALQDYQRARVLAETFPGGSLQVYEAYRKAADAQGARENFESAVLLYRAAVELGGLTERAKEDPTLAGILQAAEEDTQASRYGRAFENYQLAVRVADSSLPTVTHVVQSGEYLILIASRYDTTVQAIALVNNLANPGMIVTGQKLIIPVPPE